MASVAAGASSSLTTFGNPESSNAEDNWQPIKIRRISPANSRRNLYLILPPSRIALSFRAINWNVYIIFED
jgi:hypothetical protein